MVRIIIAGDWWCINFNDWWLAKINYADLTHLPHPPPPGLVYPHASWMDLKSHFLKVRMLSVGQISKLLKCPETSYPPFIHTWLSQGQIFKIYKVICDFCFFMVDLISQENKQRWKTGMYFKQCSGTYSNSLKNEVYAIIERPWQN